jgi:hypothetical protein
MTTIADRIKKLLELSKSDNVHEAGLAAAEAQRLMLKHGIESADLTAPPEVESIKIDRAESRATWFRVLAKPVMDVCFCDGYATPGADRITMLGRANDVRAAAILLDWLGQEILRLCEIEWQAAVTNEHGRTWKNAFRIAAAAELGKRLKASREKSMLEEAAGSSTAMIRVETYAMQAKQAISKWKADAGVKTTKGQTSYRTNDSAAEAGRRAAGSVNLSPPTRALRA